MSTRPHRSSSAEAVRQGVMSPPTPRGSTPALMSLPGRPGRGFMRPDPNLPSIDWSKDGVAFLWLLALMLGFVLSVGLFRHGIGQR